MARKSYMLPAGLSSRQRTILDTWLLDWRLAKILGESRQVPDQPTSGKSKRGDSAFDRLVASFEKEPDPAAGQIRLLAPDFLPDDHGPTFVAILEQREEGTYLAAPFSRFQEPGTSHEFHMRVSPPAISVLSLWNVRAVSDFVLRKSWLVDVLTPPEIADALDVYREVCRSAPIPNRLIARVGVPLIDPRDPRFEYMTSEGLIWKVIAGFPSASETPRIIQMPVLAEVAMDHDLKLAADSTDEFVCCAVFEIKPRRLFVHVFVRPREKTLHLVATDAAGEPTRALDETLVSLRDIGLAGRIESGQSLVSACAPKELALRTPAGKYLRAKRVGRPESIRPFSYLRLLEMLGVNPDAASVLTDSELRCLIQNCPYDSHTAASLQAEIYFRAWLYEGVSRNDMRTAIAGTGCPEIERLLDGPLAKGPSQQTWTPDVADGVEMDALTRAVWDRLAVRIRSFMHADGIIPVVTGESAEAIPIAFTLRNNELPGTAIRDVAGIPMPLWKEAGEIFGDLLAQHIGVQIQCSTRGTGRQFDGESFELPVVMAVARKRGSLPDYPTLTVMASGAIRGDTVAPVLGIEAKMALARKMGVKVFVTPGAPDGEAVMGVTVGMTIPDIIHKLTPRLERAGLDRLDTRTAAKRLNALGDEIHLGTVSLSEATVRLDRYEKMLEQGATSKVAAEGLIRAKVLRGAIANHSGNPQAGAKATLEAASLAAKHRMPLLYVNAVANRVVSLADLGRLAEAEAEGRRLLEWVLHEFAGTSTDQMQAEMVASGVLGGQALLHMAVQGTGCGPESLRLLSRALEIAKELRLSADICRDAIQIALWHALLDPMHTEAATEKALAVLDAHHGEWSTTSHAYLRRVRFLGAYRTTFFHGIQGPGFVAWPLPECHHASLNWVRATAQKYRGALLAKHGAFDDAKKDFEEAWTILDRESPALLRFIGGTVALAAGEAMLEQDNPLAMAFLQKARAVFSLQAGCFDGPVRGDLWLSRTDGLLKGVPSQSLPNPQKNYLY